MKWGFFIRSFFLCLVGAFVVMRCTKNPKETLFASLPASQTGITFENRLHESDSFNIIEYLYFFNGAGVSVGDLNNDGLADLYFVSNQESNRLYLNKGEFKFEDITAASGTQGVGNWKTGVTMADVNGDSFLDIFVCGVGGYKDFNGRNQLLINNGDLTFSDQTQQYGLSAPALSTHATFFDYDKDGDLDMYLLNHSVHSVRSYGDVRLRLQHDSLAGDRLYRNELIPLGKSEFTEVTEQAGIHNSQIGYGLGVSVSDLNNDGYLDLYVSNDFHENDYLYMNQGDGTFRQEMESSMTHTSRFSMGNDIGDINNDGWQDVVTLDMLPADETVIKSSAGEDPFEIFQFKLSFGYHYQLARNTLQLNRGLDSEGHVLFSDIALLSGVGATDWSWAPLLADFDNDGYKDLFVANGIERRPNDLDYINFIASDSVQRTLSDHQIAERMPSGKVSNYVFRNNGNLLFENASEKWMGLSPTLSNGAAYGDLDNDGDLDLVTNNLNELAGVYRNNLSDSLHRLTFILKGEGANSKGVGSRITAFIGKQSILQELVPARGWQSSSDYPLHIGLGKNDRVDSVRIIWPDGRQQTLLQLEADQRITVDQKDATTVSPMSRSIQSTWMLQGPSISFTHKEDSFVAFENERLIPHMLSTQGPQMATGDVNGDKLDDVFITGAAGQSSALFIQNSDGKFLSHNPSVWAPDSLAEDIASLIVDVNNDGSNDIVIVSAGQKEGIYSELLLPRLYLNDGSGRFIRNLNGMPRVHPNASCLKPVDFDRDGDLDLFIGSRLVPGRYGQSPTSLLLLNDSHGNFKVDDNQPALKEPGMVTDAIWSDVNQDGRPDLILVGEWMPITILLQREDGELIDQTSAFGLQDTEGWWNSLTSADLDGDGDLDYVIGNLGLNSRLRATVQEPVELWIGDIDNNGSQDPILTYFNDHQVYPFVSRDQLVRQVPALKRKFLKYADFSHVRLSDIITPQQQTEFKHLKAHEFTSVWLENRNQEKWILHALPLEMQFSTLNRVLAIDVNKDGHTDLVGIGNFYAVQPELGRYDASYGSVLKGDGKGQFTTVNLPTSGFVVKGEGRDLKMITNRKGEEIILVGKNNEAIQTFRIP